MRRVMSAIQSARLVVPGVSATRRAVSARIASASETSMSIGHQTGWLTCQGE